MNCKKIFFLVYTLFFSIALFSQNKISFSELNIKNENLSKNFKNYKIIEIKDETHLITDEAEFTINYINKYTFNLKENRFLANDCNIIVKNEIGTENKKVNDIGFDGKYFVNANCTKDNQIALSIYQNQYTIFINSLGNEIYIEPLTKFDKLASPDYYVCYETKDINTNMSFQCLEEKNVDVNHEEINKSTSQPTDNCKTVELNYCIDYSMFAQYTSINGVINRTLEVLNITQLDYSISNGLNYDVNFKLKRCYIITCNNCNYWPSTTSINTNANNFTNILYYSNMFDYASDIRVFWQNHDYSSNILGLGTNPFSFDCPTTPLVTVKQVTIGDVYTTNVNSAGQLLAHEIGHNFNCGHKNDYPNLMMFCCYTGHTWHPDSINTINYRLQNSNCYYDCTTDSCNNEKVQNLAINVDAENKLINASWQAEEGIQYKTRLYNFTTNTWSDYINFSFPSNTISYNYNNDSSSCSNKYKFEIVPICSDFDGFSQIIVFTVPIEDSPNLVFESTVQDEILCSTLEYTFSVNASYPGTTPIYQWKINNLNVGNNSPNYTTSSLQNNDVLSCEITSNEICLNSQTDTVSKTVIVVPQPCNNLANIEFDLNDIVFYPNPVKNIFTIKSISDIKNITIYNILGQKVLEKKINNSETNLNLTSLSNASYFAKIELENKILTIKIIVDK